MSTISTTREWIQVYERIETREELKEVIDRLQLEYDDGFGARCPCCGGSVKYEPVEYERQRDAKTPIFKGETSTEGEKSVIWPDREAIKKAYGYAGEDRKK